MENHGIVFLNFCGNPVNCTLHLFFPPVYTYLSSQPRSNAPHTPRIVLLGATGSGKGVQASLLANKYNIVNGKNQITSYLYIPFMQCWKLLSCLVCFLPNVLVKSFFV